MANHSFWYFDARICKQGHVINERAYRDESSPLDSEFCPTCGSENLVACSNCDEHIRGALLPEVAQRDKFLAIRELFYAPPAYCAYCGHVFPWTEAKLTAASDFLDLVDQETLSPNEKSQLIADLPALSTEGPQTPVAAARWKKALGKVGTDLYSVGIKVVGDLAAAAVKSQIGL